MFSFFNIKDIILMVLKALLPSLATNFINRNKSASEVAEDLKERGVVTPEIVGGTPVAETPADTTTEVDPMWAAFDKLDASKKAHWAYFGQARQRPDLDAIEKLLGSRPKLAAMKESWKAYNAAS